MTKRQLKALEALPDVIDALTSLAEDAERLRAAMAKASGLGVLPSPSGPKVGNNNGMSVRHLPKGGLAGTEGPPQPLMLPTPERAEFEASKLNPAPYDPAAEEERPYQKRQRELMAAVRGDPRREARLAQFKYDETEEELPQ